MNISFTNYSDFITKKIKLFSQFSLLVFIILFLKVEHTFSQSPPNLLVPVNDATCITLTPTLEWDITINAVGYAYQVSTNENFTSFVAENLTFDKREITLPKLNPNTDYYWRAGSRFSGDPDIKWATHRKFTTTQNAPNLLTPANFATCQNNNITFTWSAIPNSVSYQIQVSEFANFSSFTNDTVVNGTVTSASLFISKGFTTFYWRVRSKIGTCNSDWSEVFEYQTKLGAPQITYPLNGSNGVQKGFNATWANANGASNYDIQVSANVNFTSTVFENSNLTANSIIVDLPDNNTTYYLRLRSKNTNCTGDWSSPVAFKTQYAKVSLTSPAQKSTCLPFESEYKWQPMAGVQAYTIEISYNSEFTQKFIELNIRRADTIITIQEPSKIHYWRVKASDVNNDGEWSDPREFTSTIDAPIPLFPLDKQENVSLSTEIRWKYLSQINGPYRLQIAKDSTFEQMVIDDENAVVDIYTKLSTNFLPDYNTIYYWRVYAQLSPCKSGWSKVFSFKTVVGFPELISPENDATNQPLTNTFTWQDVAVSKSFNIEFSLQSNFTNIESNSKTQIGATEVTISNFKPNTKYYWRVRGNNEWGLGPWSPVFSFETGVAQAGVPTLISPNNNSTKVNLETFLTWSEIENAEQYRVQISDRSNFSNILINELVNEAKYSISNLSNFTEYYWRVSAVNKTQESPFPARFMFRTLAANITESANLSLPTNDATEIDPKSINFTWTTVKEAEIIKGGSYKLTISDKDDFTNIVYENPNIYNPNFNYFGNDLKPLTKYYWRITASNEAGIGPHSEISSFTTKDIDNSISNDFIFPFIINPNPTSDYINLDFKGEIDFTGKEEIEIVNINGQVVKSFTLTPFIHYDISDLPNGRYSVKIKTLTTLYYSKFIKD